MSIQKKHKLKNLFAFIAVLCLIFVSSTVQAGFLENLNKFTRNLIIGIVAVLVLIFLLLFVFRDSISSVLKSFKFM